MGKKLALGDLGIGVVALRKEKKGRKAYLEVSVSSGSSYFNPNTAACKGVAETLKRGIESGPVKETTFQPGEKIANLADQTENRRSLAAMLARRYRMEIPRLGAYYAAMRKRVLEPEEVEVIFKLVNNLGVK